MRSESMPIRGKNAIPAAIPVMPKEDWAVAPADGQGGGQSGGTWQQPNGRQAESEGLLFSSDPQVYN